MSRNAFISLVRTTASGLRPILIVAGSIVIAAVLTVAVGLVVFEIFIIEPSLNDTDSVLRSMEAGFSDSVAE